MTGKRLFARAGVAAACCLCVAHAFGQDVTSLIAKLPAGSRTEAEQISRALVRMGPEGVRRLARELREPGKGNDAKARYAFHGLAIHVSRPGGETDRRMFASAVAELLDGDYPIAVKGFFVRQLQLAGSRESVDEIGRFLLSEDHDMCEYASQALLRIGEGAPREFLRALPRAKGENRLTIMRALGVLRERAAVPELLRAAEDPGREVRLVALWALANTGDPRAEEVLERATRIDPGYERARTTNAYLLFARRLADSGRKADAGRIYRKIWRTETGPQSRHLKCAALRGLAESLGGEAMDELRAAMKSDDLQIRTVAKHAAISTPGEGITRSWMAEMTSPKTSARAGTLEILAERGDPLALPAILKAFGDREREVRVAAVRAAGRLAGGGGARAREAIDRLVEVLGGTEGPERTEARLALQKIPGDEATEEIARSLGRATPAVRGALLGVLAARGAKGELGRVLDCADAPDQAVRLAAIEAAGALADESSLDRIVRLMPRTTGAKELAAAEKAACAVVARATDMQACERAVVPEVDRAEPRVRCALLKVLGRIGTDRALREVVDAVEYGHAEVQDAAIRVLGEWPDASAAEPLLRIAKTAEKLTHRVLALRGYVRVVGLASHRPLAERLASYRRAMEAAPRHEDKRLVFSGLAEVPHLDALRMVEPYLDDPALRNEAASAVIKIARAVGNSNKAEAMAALDKVKRVVTNRNVLKQADKAAEFIHRFEDYVTTWLVAGPYKGKSLFKHEFPPEKPADSPEAKAVAWRPWIGEGDKPWFVDFQRIDGLRGNNRCAYLRADLHVPERVEVRFEIGTDDGVKVWLNGEVIHENDVPRGFTAGEDKVNAALKGGWNRLMLKVTQGGGDWSAAVRVRAADGSKLEGLRIRAE